jgi:hypothetical protein
MRLLRAFFEGDQRFKEIQLFSRDNAIKCIAERVVTERRWSIATF